VPTNFASIRGARRFARGVTALLLAFLLILPGTLSTPTHAAATASPRQAAAPADGTLIRDPSNGRVSIYWAGRLHWIESPAVWTALGYTGSATTPLTTAIPYGNTITLNTVANGLIWPLAPVKSSPVLLTLGNTQAVPGQTLALQGAGFTPGEVVSIYPPNSAAINIGTDGSGGFQVNIPILAAVTLGIHHVFVQGAQSGLFGVQVFDVAAASTAPTESIVPNPVDRGTNLLVSGAGFSAGEQVQIFLAGGAAVAVTNAAATGIFGPTAVFVPATLSLGAHSVLAYGTTSHRMADVGVTIAPLVLPTATPLPTSTPMPPTLTPIPSPTPPHSITIAATSSALPGGRVLISGSGFAPSELVLIRFNNVVVEDVPTNGAGVFANAAIILPTALGAGRYLLTVTGVTSGLTGQAEVTVNIPPPVVVQQIFLSAGTVSPGAHLTVAGRGFAAGETILLRFDGGSLNAVNAGSSGAFSFGFSASKAIGPHTVSATGGRSGKTASATYTVLHPVTAGIGLLASNIHRGSTILVNGNNFLPGEIVLIKFRGRLVQAATADHNGRFSRAGFKVPGNTPYGISTVTIVGSRSGRQANSQVRVTAGPSAAAHASASSTRLHRGGKLLISGSGFTPKEIVLISYRGKLVKTATADHNGNVNKVPFTIPSNSPYGTASITLKGTKSERTATVKVNVTRKPSIGISVSPTTVRRGGSLTVTGHGFTGGEIVLIYLHGSLLQAPKTDGKGSFGRTRLTVPRNMARGVTVVLAKGARSGRTAQVKVVIT
jgi:hypothetical protein